MPLVGNDLLVFICNQTSYPKFCVDNLSKTVRLIPDAEVDDIADSSLLLGQGRANESRGLIDTLLQTSEEKNRPLLQRCQLLNNEAMEYLSSAGNYLNSNDIDSMVEDVRFAAKAIKSCQDFIQGTDLLVLANKNSDIMRFCEIPLVARKFYTPPGDFD